jgi:Fe-S cluster biogenesis protein NfuA
MEFAVYFCVILSVGNPTMDQTQLSSPAASLLPISSENERLRLIAAVIEDLRLGVQRDGGDMELVSVEGDKVRVRLTGACVTCSLASQTLGGVRRHLMQALGAPLRVVPAVD